MPAIIAAQRGHVNANSIFVMNLFFGWTIIGWVGCLAWSVSGTVEPEYQPYSRRVSFED